MKIKILVWGTGSGWLKIKKYLNEKNIEIVAFIDTHKKEEFKDNTEIIYPNEIKYYNYDYIVIASSANKEIINQLKFLNISKIKIIDMWEALFYIEKAFKMKKYLEIKLNQLNKKGIDTIVTGMSYARWGIDENLAPKNLINLAMDSSDLYDDYLRAKKALALNNKIKNVIIGLSYINFDYDASKVNAFTKYYCEITYRDLVDDERKVHRNMILKDLTELKFDNSKHEEIYNMKLEEEGNLSLSKYTFNEKENICKEEAIRDSNKNYPETVKCNTEIIKMYLHMLKEYGCKIIIIVFPVNKSYAKYFDKRLKKQFYTIMNELKLIYNFEIFDYFDCKEILDSEFRDGSHLNINGGKKFTGILNEHIFQYFQKN